MNKYIDLESSCLTKKEMKEVIEIIYKYKEVFRLRNEIGTCSNIEVEIDVMDKSPFFIRPCCLGILKEGFSPYSSPVMLIRRKLIKDEE